MASAIKAADTMSGFVLGDHAVMAMYGAADAPLEMELIYALLPDQPLSTYAYTSAAGDQANLALGSDGEPARRG